MILRFHCYFCLATLGNQPKLAEMFHIVTQHRLPGYESTSEGSIEIYYVIPDGIQDVNSTIFSYYQFH